jgi:hypothetical protein
MAIPPPIMAPSPTPTAYSTPQQQTTTAAEETPPPVALVAGASLRLAFQTPSTWQSSVASSIAITEYTEVASTAAGTTVEPVIDEFTSELPSYLLRLAGTHENLGVNLSNVLEEAAELGDGGDSDQDGDDARDHDVALTASNLERMSLLEEADAVEDTDDNCVVLARGGGLLAAGADTPVVINIPDTPSDWEPPSQKTEQGEPDFLEVDNPGDWSRFVFRPEFGTTAPSNTRGTVCLQVHSRYLKIRKGYEASATGSSTTRGGRKMAMADADDRVQLVRTCSQSQERGC